MATSNEIILNSIRYRVAADNQLPKGKRAFARRLRQSQGSDPGHVKTMRWKIGGTPMGQSTERADGFLGTDYTVNLDHRFDDLICPVAARNTLSLSSLDPIASASAQLGGFAFGGAALGGGTANTTPQNISHMDEDRGYLFCHRGAFSTQVNISATSPSVVHTKQHGSVVYGAQVWRGSGRLGCGSATPIQSRIAVSSTSSTYADISISGSARYAYEMAVGSDRLWMVDGDSGSTNRAKYTLDDFTTISNAFTVGDRDVQATGIGTLAHLTTLGFVNGLFSFTDAGKPVPILRTLRGHRDTLNCAHFAELWGWLFITTDFGLYAWNGATTVNPVGPENIKGFEGPIDGASIYVYAWREALLACFLGTDGNTYLMWGLFGPDTAATGKPDWYTFRRFSSTEAHCIFSTNLRTNPTILVGEGTSTLSHYTMGRRGRDIADSNYRFDTGGGEWYGSTSRRDPTMRKNLRYAKFITENGSAARTIQLAVSVDGASYVNVGSATTTSGIQTVRPTSGGAPLSTVNGFTLKPRMTLVNNSTTTPTQVRGYLDLVYDERPDMVEEISAMILLGAERSRETEIAALHALADQEQGAPVAVILPNSTTTAYGMIVAIGEEQDIGTGEQMGVPVTIHIWETS